MNKIVRSELDHSHVRIVTYVILKSQNQRFLSSSCCSRLSAQRIIKIIFVRTWDIFHGIIIPTIIESIGFERNSSCLWRTCAFHVITKLSGVSCYPRTWVVRDGYHLRTNFPICQSEPMRSEYIEHDTFNQFYMWNIYNDLQLWSPAWARQPNSVK